MQVTPAGGPAPAQDWRRATTTPHLRAMEPGRMSGSAWTAIRAACGSCLAFAPGARGAAATGTKSASGRWCSTRCECRKPGTRAPATISEALTLVCVGRDDPVTARGRGLPERLRREFGQICLRGGLPDDEVERLDTRISRARDRGLEWLDDGARPNRQRNPVVFRRLHPFGGTCPEARVDGDLPGACREPRRCATRRDRRAPTPSPPWPIFRGDRRRRPAHRTRPSPAGRSGIALEKRHHVTPAHGPRLKDPEVGAGAPRRARAGRKAGTRRPAPGQLEARMPVRAPRGPPCRRRQAARSASGSPRCDPERHPGLPDARCSR